MEVLSTVSVEILSTASVEVLSTVSVEILSTVSVEILSTASVEILSTASVEVLLSETAISKKSSKLSSIFFLVLSLSLYFADFPFELLPIDS